MWHIAVSGKLKYKIDRRATTLCQIVLQCPNAQIRWEKRPGSYIRLCRWDLGASFLVTADTNEVMVMTFNRSPFFS